MTNIEAYDANLDARLKELKLGDPAYEWHQLCIRESILFSDSYHEDKPIRRILDCGSGLGFTTAWLADQFSIFNHEVEGIDPSEKAISLARKEHREINFYQSTAEKFPQMMEELQLELYDHAVLNMVLHSVDDQAALDILSGVKKCLVPKGTIHLLVPGEAWLIEKLDEYARDLGMKEDQQRVGWVMEQIENELVEIPVRISGGDYYQNPLRIYRRTIETYGEMLRQTGYGVWFHRLSQDLKEIEDTVLLPFWELDDHTPNLELMGHLRTLLMSFSLPEEQRADIEKYG
jgi:SAM-dependent methyltransferase